MTSTPPYARIVADIRASIRSGELAPGGRVPSAREITRRWDVAIATATKVLAALQSEGLVRPIPGVGTVVAGGRGAGEQDSREQNDGDQADRVPGRTGRPRASESGLDLDTVVIAGIRVADMEGGTGFSMRLLAAELGVSAMALYRHVRGKPDLLRAMAGRVFSENPLPEEPESWRQGLELVARREWEIYRRHPWVLEIVSLHRPLMIESMVAHTEWTLGLLRRAGAEPDLALRAVVSLNAYTMGMAGQVVRDIEETRETGVDRDQWWSERSDRVGEVEYSGRFPYLSELKAPLDVDAAFEFGLARLLDGFELFVGPGRR